jgi:hypothetical protein
MQVRTAVGVAITLASLFWSCTPPAQTTNCVDTVSLAHHPGVLFHGTGVPAGGGDYSVDVVANPTTCAVPTYTADSWITITQEVPDRGTAIASLLRPTPAPPGEPARRMLGTSL